MKMIIATILLALAAGQANADGFTQQVVPNAGAMIHKVGDDSVRVTFPDLDLSREEGVVTLYQRLKTSARQVCGSFPLAYNGGLQLWRVTKQCRIRTLTDAVRNIDNPRLSALHSG